MKSISTRSFFSTRFLHFFLPFIRKRIHRVSLLTHAMLHKHISALTYSYTLCLIVLFVMRKVFEKCGMVSRVKYRSISYLHIQSATLTGVPYNKLKFTYKARYKHNLNLYLFVLIRMRTE